MSGHGHVTPNADGSLARCGGPGICVECSVEFARQAKLPTCAVCHAESVAHHGVLCPDCLDRAKAAHAERGKPTP